LNIADAVNCLKTAIELYTDEGRFSIAAKHQKELAELYEGTCKSCGMNGLQGFAGEMEYEQCIEAYQQAADFYEGEGSTSAANGCLLKVAQYSAQLEKYDKAIEIFEQVAKNSLDNNLLKWSCKEYFLKSGLCYLCSQVTPSCFAKHREICKSCVILCFVILNLRRLASRTL
jgi:alpha-soluble NSF attachment protein